LSLLAHLIVLSIFAANLGSYSINPEYYYSNSSSLNPLSIGVRVFIGGMVALLFSMIGLLVVSVIEFKRSVSDQMVIYSTQQLPMQDWKMMLVKVPPQVPLEDAAGQTFPMSV